MQFDKIPAELRSRAQWVVWRPVIRNNEDGTSNITKPPFQPAHPQYGADVKNPAHWGTFETAVQCMKDNPSLVSGIGFVFTQEDEFFGIDIDDESKVPAEFLDLRRKVVQEILSNANTYTEVSPSGNGLHLIAKGKLPATGRRSVKLQLEVYGAERYFTITGNLYGDRGTITDQQEFLTSVFADFMDAPQLQAPAGDINDSGIHRRLDLSDEEVIREATNLNPTFAPRFNAQTGCGPGAWSETFMAIIGILDQITGKVEQLQRIVFNSPMVQNAPPSNAGESRLLKAQRNFNHVLSRVRGNNTQHLGRVEHGRSIMEAINGRREEEARKNAEAILAQSEEGFSKDGVHLLKAFPLDPVYLTLIPPPGIVGEFAQATAAATHNPFLKFSLPATLATLSGIVGRMYKLPNRSGLNANYILAAATSTGKTQTMDAWERFVEVAARSIENTLSGPSRSRIIKASTSSIQGIFEDFMERPSAAWFISECASQLSQMSNPKSVTDSQLRDAYNDLYDASRMGRVFSPPRSVANRKANLEPIENLSISTYWTTTTSKFDVFNDDAQDGFLSRVIIIRHTGRAGEAVPDWEVTPHLPQHLQAVLAQRIGAAKNFDETFDLSKDEAAKLITTISTAQIEGQVWAFRQIAERVKNASLDGTMPMAYTAVSRLPMTALRLSGLLAVMDNPYTPAITQEQFNWAFGYLLQNTAALLSDMDTGELGASMSKDVEVIVREFKRMMKKQKAVGLKRGDITRTLKGLQPFRAQPSPGEAVKRTIAEMIANGQMVEIEQMEGHTGRGPKPVLLMPTEDGVWA